MTIGDRINCQLKKINKSKNWLSKESGVAYSYIYNLTKNTYKNPTIDIVEKISKALNVSTSRLLGEKTKVR